MEDSWDVRNNAKLCLHYAADKYVIGGIQFRFAVDMTGRLRILYIL